MTGVRPVPRADEVLARFFSRLRSEAAGRRVERLRRAESALRECMEQLAPQLLTASELALVALERQFEPRGAVARVAGADLLLLTLPVFLGDVHWHGVDLEDRRTRIRLAEPLAWEVQALPELRGRELGLAAWTVEAAVRHEIWLYRQERESARND